MRVQSHVGCYPLAVTGTLYTHLATTTAATRFQYGLRPNVPQSYTVVHCVVSEPSRRFVNKLDQLICCVQVMLAELVHHVPQLLEHLPHIALAQLLASCVSLRKHVHEHVTKISCAMDCHDVRVLTTDIWPRLTHLELNHSRTLDLQSISLLAKATHRQLQSLSLSYSEIDSHLAEALLSVAYPNLKSLHLSGNSLTTSMTYLADAHMPLLEELELHDSRLGIKSMVALSKGSWLQLRTLILSRNSISAAGIHYLAEAYWPRLETINLDETGLNVSGMAMLLCCCKWPCLQTLGLNRNHLYHMEELSDSNQCLLLKHLYLAESHVGPDSLRPLSQPRWCQLESIDLSKNRLYGISELVRASWPALKVIRLDDNPLAADAMADLCKGDWPLLECLYLCR